MYGIFSNKNFSEVNKKIFLFLLIAAFFGTLLRIYIINNFLISIIGSFFFGFVVAGKFSKSINQILLTGFCSCFTSFSGFINFIYQLISEGQFLKILLYLNAILVMNLFMMNLGSILSRKIN